MLNYEAARQLIAKQARSFGTEIIDISNADRRVLSGPIVADRDYPPFDRATMDGYAVRSEDVRNGVRSFTLQGSVHAGEVYNGTLQGNECVQIMTGAPVPAGADMVVQRELTTQENGQVNITIAAAKPFQAIARRGEDLLNNDVVIGTAMQCDASVAGILATLGNANITVKCRPKVAMFTTGNEVIEVDAPIQPWQIRNANRYVMNSLLQQWKIVPQIQVHVPDDPAKLTAAFHDAMDHDIIIISGGVSAGDADFVPASLTAAGATQLFHKISIRPGKPLWCGISASGGIIFALPGNPISALIGYYLFIDHYIRYCYGLPPKQKIRLPMAVSRKSTTTLDEFFLFRFGETGAQIEPVFRNSSGDIRLGLGSNGFALHPAGVQEIVQDKMVDCWTW